MGNQVTTHDAFDNVKSPENLLYRLAYSSMRDMSTIVLTENGDITWNWGVDPDVDLPEQDSILALIRNMNQWRKGEWQTYLHEGRMQKPAPMIKYEKTVTIRCSIDMEI